jgi:penicillin-binding protein 2
MELMAAVDRAFRGHPSGAAVIVEVNTGRIRAIYSKPAYDLNEMSGRLSQRRFNELRSNPFRPLIDKTVYESYFPGSTFKPITALAALGDSVVDRRYRVDCPGYYELGNRRFRCTQVHGEVDMEAALVGSCNIYFWRLAEHIGLARLNRYARQFGFGSPTGVGINTETAGFLATREWFERRYGRFRLGHTLNAAIGQGNTRASLVQIATAYAAIANGGTLYKPQLIEEISLSDGEVVQRFEPEVSGRIGIEPDGFNYVTSGLFGVVNDPNGTAYNARIEDGVPIAGKTGTAEVSRHTPREGESPQRTWYLNRDHAWFAGFGPADNPRVAIVVLVEHGGAGGRTAAPIGTRILQEYLGGLVEAASPAEGRGGD